jgi:hypothetical protein
MQTLLIHGIMSLQKDLVNKGPAECRRRASERRSSERDSFFEALNAQNVIMQLLLCPSEPEPTQEGTLSSEYCTSYVKTITHFYHTMAGCILPRESIEPIRLFVHGPRNLTHSRTQCTMESTSYDFRRLGIFLTSPALDNRF